MALPTYQLNITPALFERAKHHTRLLPIHQLSSEPHSFLPGLFYKLNRVHTANAALDACPPEDGFSAYSSLLSTGPTGAHQGLYLNAPSCHGWPGTHLLQ